MKVIRITSYLDYGGIEKVFQLHGKYLKGGYDLTFVALCGGGHAETWLRDLGYTVIVLNTAARIPSWTSFKQLYRLFRSMKPDVVHTCGGEANFHGLVAAFFAGVKVRIGEEIGIPSHSPIAKATFKLVYKTAHRVIGISRSVGNWLIENEVPVAKVRIIYNPIDSGIALRTARTVSKTFRICYVGRLEPIKNLTILVDLLDVLRGRHFDRSFELLLIGEGSQRSFLTQYVADRELSQCVFFSGYVAEPKLLAADADVFILPSLFEGFGLACIEAIQLGLPVIVSRSGGMVEYVTDSVTGFLFDPGSLDELVNKTEVLLKMDPEAISKMVARAFLTINDLFSADRYLDELYQLYSTQK